MTICKMTIGKHFLLTAKQRLKANILAKSAKMVINIVCSKSFFLTSKCLQLFIFP
eukprot:01874.XXX_13139_13303_1 [CDS] Oithona nana genome sequencing.